MSSRLERCQVRVSLRLIDAMRAVDLGAVEIALVMDDEHRLVGTMTDGDIRRGLLGGASLESPLAPYMTRKFTAVGLTEGRAEVLDLMHARNLNQIPVIDSEGRLLGLHLLRELVGRMERMNSAVVMAGGRGVRLRPITDTLPKPMIKVAGRPILERLILHLVGHGIRNVYLSINYLGHIIQKHFGDGSAFGCRIEYLHETQPLGTGGALSLLPQRPREPLLVMNGDLVTQVDLGAMLDFHASGGYLATVGVREYAHELQFGCLETRDNRVIQFEEKPVERYRINIGMYVLAPELLARVPANQEFPITSLFEDCLRRGDPVGAYETEDDWIDVGQREQLRMARGGVDRGA